MVDGATLANIERRVVEIRHYVSDNMPDETRTGLAALAAVCRSILPADLLNAALVKPGQHSRARLDVEAGHADADRLNGIQVEMLPARQVAAGQASQAAEVVPATMLAGADCAEPPPGPAAADAVKCARACFDGVPETESR